MTIRVFDITGEFAVATEDGHKVFVEMQALLNKEQSVELDFKGVRVISTPFFNAAVGRILKDVSPEELQRNISFKNLTRPGQQILSKVIVNAMQVLP